MNESSHVQPGDAVAELQRTHETALQLESAISALLHAADVNERQLANDWLTAFSHDHSAWSAALYLIFPPPGVSMGLAPGVRFFALNLVLHKVRSEGSGLTEGDAKEIYATLMQQLPGVSDPLVRSRLCLVIAATVAVAGAYECEMLVTEMVEGPAVPYDLAIEVLTALAEEIVHRSRSLSYEVTECMQECSSYVCSFIEHRLASPQAPQILTKSFSCLSSWRQSGVTLTELHRDFSGLHHALLAALHSPHEEVQAASAQLLAELVGEVDVLRGREEAVKATITGLLCARSTPGAAQGPLVPLVTAVGVAEAQLLSQGGQENLQMLQWLLDLTRSNLGLPAGTMDDRLARLSWAAMAAEVWPRAAAVGRNRRAPELQNSDLFSSVLQALLGAASFPDSPELDDDEIDVFMSFRASSASDAMLACYNELGTTFVRVILEKRQTAATWQAAEVVTFAAMAVSSKLLRFGTTSAEQRQLSSDELAAADFLADLFLALPGAPAVIARGKDNSQLPPSALLNSALQAVETYAPFCACHMASLEAAVSYSLGALHIMEARNCAAAALRALCEAAAPHIAAARALAQLMSSCQEVVTAAATSAPAGGALGLTERLAIMRGMAAVAAALPPQEAQAAVTELAAPALGGIARVAPLAAEARTLAASNALAADLAVVATVISTVSEKLGLIRNWGHSESQGQAGGGQAVLVPLLQSSWPLLDQVAASWPDDAPAATALCAVWEAVARAVGNEEHLGAVLPQVIAAACHMFQQHLQAASLTCLAAIVEMPPIAARAAPSVEAALSAIPRQLASALPLLAQLAIQAGPGGQVAAQERQKRKEAGDCLTALWRLGGAFLHFAPHLLLPSGAFPELCSWAIESMQGADADVAVAAAVFLAETVSGCSLDGREGGREDSWHIPTGLMHHVDDVLVQQGSRILKEVMQLLLGGVQPDDVAGALADVARSLCVRYRKASCETLASILKHPNALVKKGVLSESTLERALGIATRDPALPRGSFREFMRCLSQVCNGLLSPEALDLFQL